MMDATEQARRSDALYYSGNDGINRRWLCDKVASLEAKNAKLRELVRILYYCGLPWKDCDKCAMNGAEMHVKISDVAFCDGMYDRMRELGVDE